LARLSAGWVWLEQTLLRLSPRLAYTLRCISEQKQRRGSFTTIQCMSASKPSCGFLCAWLTPCVAWVSRSRAEAHSHQSKTLQGRGHINNQCTRCAQLLAAPASLQRGQLLLTPRLPPVLAHTLRSHTGHIQTRPDPQKRCFSCTVPSFTTLVLPLSLLELFCSGPGAHKGHASPLLQRNVLFLL